jgi:hypothetical protein
MMTSSARPPRAVYLDINIQVTPKQISRTKADGMPIIAAPNRSPLKIIQAGPIVKMAASKPAPAKNWMNAGIRVRSSEANIHQRIRRMGKESQADRGCDEADHPQVGVRGGLLHASSVARVVDGHRHRDLRHDSGARLGSLFCLLVFEPPDQELMLQLKGRRDLKFLPEPYAAGHLLLLN